MYIVFTEKYCFERSANAWRYQEAIPCLYAIFNLHHALKSSTPWAPTSDVHPQTLRRNLQLRPRAH